MENFLFLLLGIPAYILRKCVAYYVGNYVGYFTQLLFILVHTYLSVNQSICPAHQQRAWDHPAVLFGMCPRIAFVRPLLLASEKDRIIIKLLLLLNNLEIALLKFKA